jgi:hypothetical protein
MLTNTIWFPFFVVLFAIKGRINENQRKFSPKTEYNYKITK